MTLAPIVDQPGRMDTPINLPGRAWPALPFLSLSRDPIRIEKSTPSEDGSRDTGKMNRHINLPCTP